MFLHVSDKFFSGVEYIWHNEYGKEKKFLFYSNKLSVNTLIRRKCFLKAWDYLGVTNPDSDRRILKQNQSRNMARGLRDFVFS